MARDGLGREMCGHTWSDQHTIDHEHTCADTSEHLLYRAYFHQCRCGMEVLDENAAPPPPPPQPPPYRYRYRDDPDGEWD